jgi:hypothetical protein
MFINDNRSELRVVAVCITVLCENMCSPIKSSCTSIRHDAQETYTPVLDSSLLAFDQHVSTQGIYRIFCTVQG